jgi:hypothetical protein
MENTITSLKGNLKEVLDFLEDFPKLSRGSTLSGSLTTLQRNLGRVVAKMDDLRLEQHPLYSEVAHLLEGDGKAIANPEFMRKFCSNRSMERFNAEKADKATRKRFLKLVAKADKLSELRDALDTKKVYKALFDEILANDLSVIEKRLYELKPSILTGIVDSAGLVASKGKGGKVSKAKKSIDSILAQIEKIKLSEHY